MKGSQYKPDQYYRNAFVGDVIDGDTIELTVDLGFHLQHTIRCRIRNMNAPETRGPERELGKICKDYLERELIAEDVLVRTFKADSFGRYLVDVQLPDGRDLATVMIQLGYAVPWNGKGRRPGFDPNEEYPLKDATI